MPTNLAQSGNFGVVFDASGSPLRISSVEANSLGGRAGFQVGDEVVAVNQARVETQQMLQNRLAAALLERGQAWVYVTRKGSPTWINIDPSGRSRGRLGIYTFDSNGVVRVGHVYPGSVAQRFGLRAGDQILSANGAGLRSNDELVERTRLAATGNGELNLVVRHHGYEQTITAMIPADSVSAGLGSSVHMSPPVYDGTSVRGIAELSANAERVRSILRGLQNGDRRLSAEQLNQFRLEARELLRALESLEVSRP